MLVGQVLAALPPELPGVEVGELETTRNQIASVPASKPASVDSQGWSAPDIAMQLNLDTTLVGMGQGAIFVPRMTESQLEPEVEIQNVETHREYSTHAGHRFAADPGRYIVRLGSGAGKQRMSFQTQVQEGRTAIIATAWAGLIVETINSDGDLVAETYEISRLSDGEAYGRGFGQGQDHEKDLHTWILPTGIYRISKVGTDAGSLTNYITIQLNRGELTRVELVFDVLTNAIIAGGVKPPLHKVDAASPWTIGFRLGGSLSLGAVIADDQMQSDFTTVITDLRTSLRYDKGYYHGFNELRIGESMQWLNEKTKPQAFLVTNDIAQLQSSWIRRITEWFGPYTRFTARSHLVPQDFGNASLDSSLYLVGTRGDTVQTILPSARFRQQPALYPLRLGEGLGFNLRLQKGAWIEASGQSGIAARQSWMHHVWVAANTQQSLFLQGVDSRDWGSENMLTLRLRLGQMFTFDLLGEVFLPQFDSHQFEVEELSGELRLALHRNIELVYQQELTDRKAAGLTTVNGGPRFESSNTVQLRFFVNY